MRHVCIGVLFLLASLAALAQKTVTAPPDAKSFVITFNDGHQQSFSLSNIKRMEFTPSSASDYPGRFRGKWKVGTGVGDDTFYITLDNHGNATKSIGASHGIWTAVGDEAQITWDDGWHDAIRKVGGKYEKFAYEPGKTFADSPSNVTDAVNTTPN